MLLMKNPYFYSWATQEISLEACCRQKLALSCWAFAKVKEAVIAKARGGIYIDYQRAKTGGLIKILWGRVEAKRVNFEIQELSCICNGSNYACAKFYVFRYFPSHIAWKSTRLQDFWDTLYKYVHTVESLVSIFSRSLLPTSQYPFLELIEKVTDSSSSL